MSELTPVMKAAITFAYVGGAAFTITGLLLSYRRDRPHALFAPHLVTKVLHLQTVGPTEQLFEGVPNQPL